MRSIYKWLIGLVLCVSSLGCKRIEYVDRYIVVADTTWKPSVIMFNELYKAWEDQYGQSIALPDSIQIDGSDVCHFSRRWAEEVNWYFRIRLQSNELDDNLDGR